MTENAASTDKDKFECFIVSPEKTFFSGLETAVQIPTEAGDTVILAGHAPMVFVLYPGIVRLMIGKTDKDFFVTGGVAEVTNSKAVILASSIEPMGKYDAVGEDIALKKIEQDFDRAESDAEKNRLAAEKNIAIAKKESAAKSSVPFHV